MNMMIKFTNTGNLWLWLICLVLLFLPLLYYWERKRAFSQINSFFGGVMGPRLTASVNSRRRRIRNFMFWFGLLLVWLAALGPQWGGGEAMVRESPRETVMVFDVSATMGAQDLAPTRLEKAKAMGRRLIEEHAGGRFGVVTFAGAPFLECPLTWDSRTLYNILEDISLGVIPLAGTDIEAALKRAAEALAPVEEKGGRDQVIILFSDGEEIGKESLELAGNLRRKGIRVFTVGLGQPGERFVVPPDNGSLIISPEEATVIAGLNEDSMRSLAEAGGGGYAWGGDPLWVNSVLQKGITGSQGGEIEKAGVHQKELFQIPLAVAVICLLTALLIYDRKSQSGTGRIGNKALVAAIFLTGLGGAVTPIQGEVKETNKEKTDIALSRDDGILRRIQSKRRKLAKVENVEKRMRLRYNIARLLQEAGKLQEAVEIYQDLIATYGEDDQLRGKSIWNLAVVEHLKARQYLLRKPEAAADLYESARSGYKEAMRVYGDAMGLIRNYELLLREQALLKTVINAENREQKENDQFPFESIFVVVPDSAAELTEDNQQSELESGVTEEELTNGERTEVDGAQETEGDPGDMSAPGDEYEALTDFDTGKRELELEKVREILDDIDRVEKDFRDIRRQRFIREFRRNQGGYLDP